MLCLIASLSRSKNTPAKRRGPEVNRGNRAGSIDGSRRGVKRGQGNEAGEAPAVNEYQASTRSFLMVAEKNMRSWRGLIDNRPASD